MKFSTKEDILAPIEHVFSAVSDFRSFERSGLRRNVEISNKNQFENLSAILGWDIAFQFRKRRRQFSIELIDLDAPSSMQFETRTRGANAIGIVDLVALSKERTRLAISVDIRPTTIGGRLTIQSLKLGKTKLNHRFKSRISEFAQRIESSYRK